MESANALEPIRRSAAALAVRLGIFLAIIDTLYAAFIVLLLNLSPPVSYYPVLISLLLLLHITKYLITTAILLRTVLTWTTTSYVINGHHLITHAGIYSQDEKIYELEQLKAIDVRQDWLGRFLHYGNVKLALASSGYSEQVELYDVAEPDKLEHKLEAGF